jgi:superfamily II DNA or RNA helicase
MNIPIKNIINCNNINKNKIKNIADKLDIDTNNTKEELCKSIKKKFNKNNPCNLTLYDDTDLTIKKHQLNVANHLYNNRGVIVVHSVGTGKTLTAIATAQCLLNNDIIKNVIVVTPTSLQQNFINQMMMYGVESQDISNNYTFYTIQGIVNAIQNKDVVSPSNSLIIIDEAHNLRKINSSRFDVIFKYSKKASKIMLLTATPLINYKYDIINLISLANADKPISIDSFNKMINNDNETELHEYINDVFSFYIKDKSIYDPNFPSYKIIEIFLPMNELYNKIYSNVEKGQVSKIPDFKGKNIHVFYNGLRRASNIIDKKSPKVNWIIKKIKSEKKSKFVIFSHFINMGIKPIMDWLDNHNIEYGHVTGDLTIEERQDSVTKYNNDELKILFISKAGSEGLDLKGTTFVIIMEPSWNENSIEQIIGRGIRYKSHVNLPKYKQNVIVYKLYCIKTHEYKNINNITNNYLLEYKNDMLSVDLYLRNYSWLKQQEIISFFNLLNEFKIEK